VSGWNNSYPLGDDDLEALKAEGERPIAVFAGAGAVTSALSGGFLDAFRLIVHPSLVGAGTRLFEGSYPRTGLRLRETRLFPSGTMVVHYDVVAP
jgi:riboflavin biosynthesis pyrimidine reductase